MQRGAALDGAGGLSRPRRQPSEDRNSFCNTVVEEILGDGKVGRRSYPRYQARSRSDRSGSGGVFVYIGLQPATAFVEGRIDARSVRAHSRPMARCGPNCAGVCAAGAVRSGWLGRAVALRGRRDDAAIAIERYLADGRLVDRAAGLGVEVRMSELLTVHDPRGYPPKVTGKRLGAAARKPRRQDRLSGRLPVRQFRRLHGAVAATGSPQHLPAVETRIIKPRESWVDDPDMRAKIAADGDAAILGVGFEAPAARRSSG